MNIPKAAIIVAVFVIAAFLFLQPIFSSPGNWGIYDWDQHFFYHESPRISLLTFGEFPLWTPYYCGGNLLLANPQSPFLSPFFGLVMLFGAVVGLKLEALAYLALGLIFTFLLARRLGCTQPASALAAAVFMFSSWFAARVAVGHTTFFPFALLPLVFLAYLNASAGGGLLPSRLRWGALAAVALAVMFLSGGIYPFYAAILLLCLYSLLDSISQRRISPLAIVAAILLLAALLSSVKLLPVLEFTSGVQPSDDSQLTSASIVLRGLLGREQSLPHGDLATGRDLVEEGREKELATLAGELPWGWHEYSAYIGILPLILAAGAALGYRRNWKLLMSALFFLALAFGSHLPLGPWQLIKELPFFSSLHGPSRFIIVFAFLAALLAARTLSSIRISKDGTRQTLVVAAACLLVAADLFLVSRPLLDDAFPLEQVAIASTNLGSPEIIQVLSSLPALSQYPNLLQGIGTVNCYERLRIRPAVAPQFLDGEPLPGFIGNAYIAETNQSVNFTYFSPHKITLKVPDLSSESTLVVNQNYYKGWKSNIGEAKSYSGLLSAKVSPSDSGSEIAFSYSSKPFAIGALISLAAAAALVFAFIRPAMAAAIIAPAANLIRKAESQIFRQS